MIGRNPLFWLVIGFCMLAAATPAHARQADPECALVTANAGEGIWGLLRRSGIEPNAARVKAFKADNARRLGGSDTLKKGASYCLPGAASSVESDGESLYEPLFGSAYARVPLRSNVLQGHVYYVVTGHGGPDPGTMTKYNGRWIAEDEIAYDTALRMARELMSAGATVHIIVQDPDDGIRDAEILSPDQDERYVDGSQIPRNHNRRLDSRVEIINDLYDQHRATARSQQVISVHVDAYGRFSGPRIDVHFAYATNSGRQLGATLQASLSNEYDRHQPGRGYRGRVHKRAGLKILSDTKPTAILVELGNIKNHSDQIRLVRPGNRQALAEWIVAGLREAAGARRS